MEEMPMIGLAELTVLLLFGALVVWPYWRIFSKAGFHGALSFLLLVPLVNVGMLFFLAFAEWPALRENSRPPR